MQIDNDAALLRIDRSAGVPVIELGGDVDATRLAAVSQALCLVIEEGADRIIVDLSAAAHLDAYCNGCLYGVLVRAQRRLDALGGRLWVVSSDPEIQRAIEFTGLSQVLRLFGSRELVMQEHARVQRLRAVYRATIESGGTPTDADRAVVDARVGEIVWGMGEFDRIADADLRATDEGRDLLEWVNALREVGGDASALVGRVTRQYRPMLYANVVRQLAEDIPVHVD